MTDKLKLANPNGDLELSKTVLALELEAHQKRLRQMEQNVAELEKLLVEKKKANAAERQRQAASANNKIGARKDASFKAISTAPSINLTPRGRDMVPVPYPVVQDLSDSVKASSSVRFNGKPAYLLDQTTQSSCVGDAAGSGGGVRSGTVGGEVKPVEGSRTVRIEGKRVVREGDACTMNGGNNPGIYVTTPPTSGSIKNGKIIGDTDPPIQAQTPEEHDWLSKWLARTRHEAGEAVKHPWEAAKGAAKGMANVFPAVGELLAKTSAMQQAQELEQAAMLQSLFGQTKSAQQLAEGAQEVRRTADAMELPKFEMSNAAQSGGDKIVTGASLLIGGAGIVKSGIKGVTTMSKAAARAEGEAAGGIAGGGKLTKGEAASGEGAKTAGATVETGKGAQVSAIPDQQIQATGAGVKILKTRSGQPEKSNIGAKSTLAAEKQTLANFAENSASRTYQNLDTTINERGLLAQERNLAESAGWKRANGSTWWPPYDGALPGSLRIVSLEPESAGAVNLVDRFGRTSGGYVSPAGMPLESRALSSKPKYPASVYSIDASISGVEKSTVAPWFSEKGLGVQFKLPNNVQYYLDNLMLGEPK